MQRFSHSKPFSRGSKGKPTLELFRWDSADFKIDYDRNTLDTPSLALLLEYCNGKFNNSTCDMRISILHFKANEDEIPIPAARAAGWKRSRWNDFTKSSEQTVRIFLPSECGGWLNYLTFIDVVEEYMRRDVKELVMVLPFFVLRQNAFDPFFSSEFYDNLKNSLKNIDAKLKFKIESTIKPEDNVFYSTCTDEDGSALIFTFSYHQDTQQPLLNSDVSA